ncbi:MAG TPA: extracellular solute-binding protein [Actinomycetota bacterium]
MRRLLMVVSVAALVATACSSGSDTGAGLQPSAQRSLTPAACSTKGLSTEGGAASAGPSGEAPVTIQLWSFYSGGEFKKYCEVLQDFHKLYPWISIQHTGGKSDQDIYRAYNSDTAPDMMISPGPDNVAKFCTSGAYTDLSTYLQTDNIDLTTIIPDAALRYTSYNGNQCSLPVLSDAYGMYYNKDMFQKAGISAPPKTLSELQADAKKLTVLNPDGSIKIAGFVPLQSFYESYALYMGPYSGGTWYDANGSSAFASDPSWASLLQWQQQFITDVYGPDGYHKLQEFFSKLGGADSEWSSAHGFETDQLAMTLDGEWRNAFIADDGSDVNYATAPFPVVDDKADLYGAGLIGGDVVGIPSNAQNPDAAWLLLKYLALDTQAEVKLSTVLKNVPTTFDSLKDPGLNNDEHFKTFLGIFGNQNSSFKPLTPIGSTDADLWSSFVDKWEAGGVPDLQQGLQDLATQIDNQLQLG